MFGRRGLKLLEAMRGLERALDRIFLGTGYLAGALFMGLAFFVTYDVLARKWGDVVGLPTTRVTDEISGYILVLAATWGFAYTLRADAHVRIDVLLPTCPDGCGPAWTSSPWSSWGSSPASGAGP